MNSSTATDTGPPELEMTIDITVLEHLGLKMYTSLPAVIAEYVANSWDAGALKVDITIPDDPIDESFAIQISDDGFGMSVDEVNKKFLVVGRKKREFEPEEFIDIRGNKRRIIGRKGIGKLAGFGVSGKVEVLTRKNNSYVHFEMDYDEMQRVVESKTEPRTTYPPSVISWGHIEEDNGTIVILTSLKRTRPVDLYYVRRNLARHFSVIGTGFIVEVNGIEISPAEREMKKDCEYVWVIKDEKINDEYDCFVNGWIGTHPGTVPAHINRGIVVMARGKLIQTATTFDVGGTGFTGQHALAYMVGEVHAEFLDEEVDLIATGRRSVVWEAEPAASFRHWINDKIRVIARDWAKRRREAKLKKVREIPVYKDRIANLPTRERKLIDSFLVRLIGREEVNVETIIRTANFLADGVEYKAFIDLMETIDKSGISNPEELLKFLEEWEVLDAIEMIRIIEGRFKAIFHFQELIKVRAKEVPTLHNFLVDNPWIIDPRWDYLHDELTFREALLKMFPEAEDIPEENRRIDFLCLGYGKTLHIIELKRPGSSIGRKELDQLEHYVDYITSLFGTDSEISYESAIGYIIGSKLSQTRGVREKAKRLAANRMYVRTFDNLEKVFRKVHGQFVKTLERKASRIPDTRLFEGLGRLKLQYPEPPSDED